MLRRLIREDHHISGLARELDISVPVAAKHIKILEEAELVKRKDFGKTHVISARTENLYEMMDAFSISSVVEVNRGSSILNVLKQVPGIEIRKIGDKEYMASVDGEEGYYIYEVGDDVPNVPIDEYEVQGDMEVKIKKIVPVERKRVFVGVKNKRNIN